MRRRLDFAGLGERSRADRRLLVEATLWLALARSALRTLPFRWIVRLFALSPGEGAPAVDTPSRNAAVRIGWALSAAAARTPWQSACLAQALAGSGMLRMRRIPGTVAMGVAKSATGLEAHAWLSCGGAVVTGADGHERYQVVARFAPCSGRRAA